MRKAIAVVLSLSSFFICYPIHSQTQDEVRQSDFVIKSLSTSGLITILTPDGQTTLLSSGPFLRVGRLPTVAEFRCYHRENKKFWSPFTVYDATLITRRAEEKATTSQIYTHFEFSRPDDQSQVVQLEIWMDISAQGRIDVNYQLTPINASDYVLELGISFLVPKSMRTFVWRGKGPASSYAVMSGMKTEGIYRYTSTEIYFSGNKSNVDIAAIFDKDGNGIGVVGDAENIACDLVDEGILLSHNVLVSGFSTELELTDETIDIKQVETAHGSFVLVPLSASNWPQSFRELLLTQE